MDGLAPDLMLDLRFNLREARPPCFMFIGAHSDDIEIGCGGTAMELLGRYPAARVHWIVLSTGRNRAREAKLGANALLRGAADARVTLKNFRGAYFPSEAAEIKDFFETLKRRVAPDVIFCHCRDELHQDHRTVGELAWNTWRDHVILEYEIPKYDGGLGSPSVFVPLTKSTVRRKIDLLMTTFATQRDKQWFTPETFKGLMRLRGIECNAPDGYAEAFYSRKLILGGP